MRSSRAVILVLCCSCLAAPAARAQEATEAQLLFERGAELYRDRRFGEALEAMVASNRLVPNANVVFNIAQIYELLERPIEAFNWYQRHLELARDGDARERVLERIEGLRARVALLHVQSEPTGADIYLDRVELGVVARAPRSIAVQPGAHVVILRAPGHAEARGEVEAVVGETGSIALTLPRLMGRLVLDSEPSGAEVFGEAGGQRLGTTPLALELPVGPQRLIVRRDGYIEQRIDLAIDSARVTRRALRLERDPARVANLRVEVQPAGARVWLDGREAGRAPLRLTGLLPGVRRLEVGKAEHESWSSELQLLAGTTTRVQARLIADDDRPWPYWNWLGYLGGGALFAAGAVVGGVAVSENRADASPDSVETLNHTADALMIGGLAIAGVTLLLQLTGDPPARSQGVVSTPPEPAEGAR